MTCERNVAEAAGYEVTKLTLIQHLTHERLSAAEPRSITPSREYYYLITTFAYLQEIQNASEHMMVAGMLTVRNIQSWEMVWLLCRGIYSIAVGGGRGRGS